MTARDELRTEIHGEVMAHEQEIAGKGFSGRLTARKETCDRLLAIIDRELAIARPQIERETLEAAAKVAENMKCGDRGVWGGGYDYACERIAAAIRKGTE